MPVYVGIDPDATRRLASELRRAADHLSDLEADVTQAAVHADLDATMLHQFFGLDDVLRANSTQLDRRAEMAEELDIVDVLRRNFSLLDVAGHGGDPDGLISKDDLLAALDTPSLELRHAALHVLSHPELWALLDSASDNDDYLDNLDSGRLAPDDTDGLVSLADLDAFAGQRTDIEVLHLFAGMIDTAAHGGTPDGLLSEADFDAIAANVDLPQHLRDAATRVIDADAYDVDEETMWSMAFEVLITAASFVPIVGDAIDLAYALYYLAQGDFAMMAVHAIGLVPVPGMSGSGVRGALRLRGELAELAVTEGREAVVERLALETAQNVINRAGDEVVDEVAGINGLGSFTRGFNRAANVSDGAALGWLGRYTASLGARDLAADDDDDDDDREQDR